MKSSISISNWTADVAIIVFPVGNVTIRGVMVYTIAGSFAANLWLMKDHVAPVSSISGTVNPWVWMDKYNRPHCICMLLTYRLSTFPAYLTSTSCISFPAPSQCLCWSYWAWPSYCLVVASSKVFICCAVAYIVLPDNTWQYILFFSNCSTSVLVVV